MPSRFERVEHGYRPDPNERNTGADAVTPDGVVVPAERYAWERDDQFVEVDTHELCVFADPVAPHGAEERLYTSHHCHDPRDLRAVTPDPPVVRLSWAEHGLLESVARVAFGHPPDRLTPPPESFDAVCDHLTTVVPPVG